MQLFSLEEVYVKCSLLFALWMTLMISSSLSIFSSTLFYMHIDEVIVCAYHKAHDLELSKLLGRFLKELVFRNWLAV